MGRYLEILRRAEARALRQKRRKRQKTPFGRLCRSVAPFGPTYVDPADWRQAVADGRCFLAAWGEQAEALGWTARELFGLHTPTERPAAC